MKYLTILIISLYLSSCKKDITEKCDCQLPFLTGNNYSTFLAEHNESYWYNNKCWKYLGPTKHINDPMPSFPGTNSSVWSICGDSELDCSQYTNVPNWTSGVYYEGDKVKLNNKVFVAFTQGNPMPQDTNDDIWAILCDSI